MSQSGNFTLFKSDSVTGSGAIDYVKDVFPDVTLAASDNTGLTDNSLTNPLGGFFANNDATLFGAKKLLIKDIVLIKDTTKWVGNEPTYQIIWDQSFPEISGYVFGTVRLDAKAGQNEVNFLSAGNGIGVTGKVRRVALLVENAVLTAGSANVFVDGVNTTAISFGNDNQFDSSLLGTIGPAPTAKYSAFVQGAANLTNDLHDVRFVSVQVGTLRVVGVIVYFENTGVNIEINRGTTYVDKTKAVSPAGATLPIPTLGSSLGGVFITQKSTAAAYSTYARSASTFGSLATGASGSNLVTVTTGDGVNFSSGNGIVIGSGVSNYVGSILSVSTDTLTVAPAPQIALAGVPIYSAWKSSPTLAIGASFYQQVDRVRFDRSFGVTISLLNTQNNYCIWGNNFGVTQTMSGDQTYGNNYGRFLGASGYLQIDGYFSAVEAEWFSPGGIMNHSVFPNGAVGYSLNFGFSGIVKQTLIGEAGPGWNSVVITPGTSIGVTIGLMAINIYRRLQNNGATLGVLASIDTLQSFTDRTAVNASLIALGTFKRVYADEVYLKGAWDRQYSATSPNRVRMVGAGTSVGFEMSYYGKNTAIVGTVGTATGNLSIDGVSTALTFNVTKTVASEGFHTVAYANTGNTIILEAIDFSRSYGDVTQISPGITSPLATYSGEIWMRGYSGEGSSQTGVSRFQQVEKYQGQAITFKDSVGNGSEFYANVPGIYSVFALTQSPVAGTVGIALTLNATGARLRAYASATIDLINDPYVDELLDGQWTNTIVAARSQFVNAGGVIRMNTGDCIRMFQEALTNNTSSRFRMIYLGP